jgi:hypothetical protein
MPKTLNDFLGYRVGDMIALSDMQTQTEYNKMSVDHPIRAIRKYTEPNGVFQYIGYVVETPSKQQLLILIKAMGKDFEIHIYYMDTGAPIISGCSWPGALPALVSAHCRSTESHRTV